MKRKKKIPRTTNKIYNKKRRGWGTCIESRDNPPLEKNLLLNPQPLQLFILNQLLFLLYILQGYLDWNHLHNRSERDHLLLMVYHF